MFLLKLLVRRAESVKVVVVKSRNELEILLSACEHLTVFCFLNTPFYANDNIKCALFRESGYRL